MNARAFLESIRRGWVLVLAGLVIGLGIGGSVALLAPAQYSSTFSLYVSAQQDARDSTAAYQGTLLSQQRVKSYTEIVSSTRVTTRVAQQMNLQETPAELSERITASSSTDSVLVNVAVIDPDPVRAAAIANTVASTVIAVVNDLERPASPRASPAVVVRLVEPAAVPLTPVSLGLPVLLALGAVLGVSLGAGAAVLYRCLDTSIRTLHQLESASNAVGLGTLTKSSQAGADATFFLREPRSSWAEEVRLLRASIQFTQIDRSVISILCTSSSPAEGKTTTSVSLAMAFAAAGERTILIEADLRRPEASTAFGLERSVGLTTVLGGRIRLNEAIQTYVPGGFDVLASGLLPPNPAELLGSNAMRSLIRELSGIYDHVMIDSPPVLPVADSLALATIVDGVVVCARHRQASIRSVGQTVNALRGVSARVLGVVLTMTPESTRRVSYSSYYAARDEIDAVVVPPSRPRHQSTPRPEVSGPRSDRRR